MSYAVIFRALLAAPLLLAAPPALAREDFTARATCLGHWGTFTNESVASAEQDNCDGGGQDGDNDISWLEDVTVDAGNAPPMAPAGSDSTTHVYASNLTVGEITNSDDWYGQDFTYLAWHEWTSALYTAFLMKYHAYDSTIGAYSLRCLNTGKLRGRVSSFFQSGSGLGPLCHEQEWRFLAFQYDGSTTNEIETFSSDGAGANTLLDCDGAGEQDCLTKTAGPSDFDVNVLLLVSDGGGATFDGHMQESAFFNEGLTDEEICQFCRCGGRNDVRGVGRVDACNRCIVPAYEGCRRVID